MARRLDVPTLRAALWTLRALWSVERGLRRRGLDGRRVPAPPRLPGTAARGVSAVLRRRPSTCLERALVLQRWEAGQGRYSDVVVGVQGASRDFKAHAWLASAADPLSPEYRELMRLPADFDR